MKALQIFLLIFLLVPVGCTKVDGPVDNLLGGKIRVVGHAGLGFESVLTPYPSNTLTSIRKVVEGYNADGVEVDVQITKDSVLVLLHDQTLESMTNCYGNAVEYLASELEMCRYRTDFNSHMLQDEPIITLEQVQNRYAGSVFDPWIYLDIKFPQQGADDYTEVRRVLIRAVDKMVEKYGNSSRIAATAPELESLLYLRQLNPAIELHYDSNNFEEALQLALQHSLTGIVIANDHITKVQVKRAHENGIQVIIFGVALRKDIVDAVNKHPDVIQTDNVILLQQILTH